MVLLVAACGNGGSGEVPVAERLPGVEGGEAFLELGLAEKIDAFLERPGSAFGEQIAIEMGLSGDTRYVPWLLDLQRFALSTAVDDRVEAALEQLTGVTRAEFTIENMVQYGGWLYDNNVEPGADYPKWKVGLYGMIDDEFAPLLEQVDDLVTLSRIQWGGVARGGIPELNEPVRLTAEQADFMTADELIFGSEIEGVPIAYQLRILGHHELANDTINGRPVALIFCTLCRTAILYDRELDGQLLEFETSGLLINSNKIMVDRQTDTLWSHLTGEAFAGPLGGSRTRAPPAGNNDMGGLAVNTPRYRDPRLTRPDLLRRPGAPADRILL